MDKNTRSNKSIFMCRFLPICLPSLVLLPDSENCLYHLYFFNSWKTTFLHNITVFAKTRASLLKWFHFTGT